MNVHEPIDQRPPAHVDILIVGAGVAGLVLALECKRLGFSPKILERRAKVESAGDFVVVGDSATRVFEHWPLTNRRWLEQSYRPDAYFSRHTGELVVGPYPLKRTTGRPVLRRRLMEMLEEAVVRQGIPIRFNQKVTGYFEEDDGRCGGVELAGGERVAADVVAACDGVHSRSWSAVLDAKHDAISSGSAVYRTSVPARLVFERDPALREHFGSPEGRAYMKWFSGPGMHALVFSDGDTICWSVHHPENANTSSESWSATLDGKTVAEQLLERNPDWSPALMSLIRNSPDASVNDWLLLFRDPEPRWVSRRGRIAQCGDSAHPFLPTSANGATQAIEDAVTLAAALRLGVDAGASVKESLEVYNVLRFERASCAQLMGIVHRQVHHDTDWDEILKNPQILVSAGPGKWVGDHDPESYALENFEQCLESLRKNEPFKNTNTPPGFTYQPWTCADVLRRQKEHDHLQLEGNWN